ncbi:MAG: antiterminator LoaP [Spirochaetales bacterium]|nr:antiterminator LoaP [Spirochaetales bacterium]
MNYFVIQVQTRKEEEFLSFAIKRVCDLDTAIFLPRRKLRIRRQGKWMKSISPIFPGYIFIKANNVTPSTYKTIKRVPGFIRFLKNNNNITPLLESDKRMIDHFLSFGEVVGKSSVQFDLNKKVKVICGPLKGLEGNIVKVNKRKKRIKVKIDFNKNLYLVEFGFEALGGTPGND